ncbi:MAG TPA: hypothetical protein VFF04_02195 [Candidatus Babeliales bacterium]|nr:hypothetical protein [Candidatus Babeliales bacterium]
MKNLKNLLILLSISSSALCAAPIQQTVIEFASHYNKPVRIELWRAEELDNPDFEPVFEGQVTVRPGQMARLKGNWNEGHYELDFKAKGIKRNAHHKFKIARGGQQFHFEITEKGNMKEAGQASRQERPESEQEMMEMEEPGYMEEGE